MDNAGKFITTTFAVLAVFSGYRHCQEISPGPSNTTVLAGSEARFNCTVHGQWSTITWLHGSTRVMIISRVEGILNSFSQYSALNYTTAPGVFISELIISNVRVSDAGLIACNTFYTRDFYAFLSVQVNGTLQITISTLPVVVNERVHILCNASGWLPAPQITWMINASSVDETHYSTVKSDGSDGLENALSTLNMSFTENETLTCLATIETLPEPETATVSLRVVEKPVESTKSMDHTTVIIIAVVVTVGGVLLIALIVLIVFFCCWRRRKKEESSYQSQMKKVSAQRTNDISIISKNVAGSANLAYDNDPSAYRRPLPKVPSEDSNSLRSLEAEQMYVGNRAFKVQSPPYPGNSLHLSRPAQVRHLTHV